MVYQVAAKSVHPWMKEKNKGVLNVEDMTGYKKMMVQWIIAVTTLMLRTNIE